MYTAFQFYDTRLISRVFFSAREDAVKIVSSHIKLLHQYNEAKDATQVSPAGLLLPPCRLTSLVADFAWESKSAVRCRLVIHL